MNIKNTRVNIQTAPSLPSQKTTVEQVYVKRLAEQETFMPKDEYRKKSSQINKIMRTQSHGQMPAYYSHINEIRSVKEFLYISEKLKQKNIERKMKERVDLKEKLNKIKGFEIYKKRQYYLEKKIRQFLRITQHNDEASTKTFEAFLEQVKQDSKIMGFTMNVIQSEFQRISGLSLSVHQKEQSPGLQRKQTRKLSQHQKDLYHTDISESLQIDNKEEGTNKFLTMKVANKLIGLMQVQSSKGKRTPILAAVDKKKELEDMLNKPFGGKMNFTINSFNWLIENVLGKSKAYLNRNRSAVTINRTSKGVIVSDPVNDPEVISENIQNQIHSIKKTLASRPLSSKPPRRQLHLKNRKTVATEYCVSDRIKENVKTQQIRNLVVAEQQKLDQVFVQNDSYVSHFI